MLETIKALTTEYDMLPRGGTVLCAVSGGADSMCLLHLLHTWAGEGSINSGTSPPSLAPSQMATMTASVARAGRVLVMLGDLFIDGQHGPVGLVHQLAVGGHLGAARLGGHLHAVFQNIDELMQVVPLDGGLAGPHIVVQPGGTDVVDDLVHDADRLVVVLAVGLDLDGNACSHVVFLLKNMIGTAAKQKPCGCSDLLRYDFLRWHYPTGSKGQRPFALLSAARRPPWLSTCHLFRGRRAVLCR